MGFLTYHNCSDLPILALRECFGAKKYLFTLVKKKKVTELRGRHPPTLRKNRQMVFEGLPNSESNQDCCLTLLP